MTNDVSKMSEFQWTEKATRAARALAEGKTRREAALEADITERTIYRWLDHPEFSAQVDQLTLLTGIGLRADRLRIVKRVIRQMVKDDQKVKTDKDLLDWLKYAQAETNGTDLLEQLVASLAAPGS